MQEYFQSHFYPNRYLKKYLPIFKEEFIKYYGEEHREYIEQKFTNAIFFAFIDPVNLEEFLKEMYDQQELSFTSQFLNKIGLEIDKNNPLILFHVNFDTLDCFYKLLKNKELTNNEKCNVIAFLKGLFPQIESKDLNTILKESKILDKKEQFLDEESTFLSFKENFVQYKKTFQDQESYITECYNLRNQILIKYTLRLIQEFYFLLSDKDKRYFLSLTKKEKITQSDLENHFENITGPLISLNGNIESFDKEILDKIKKGCFSKKIEEQLKLLHISYFISQGFNYGYNYNRYWEDNHCKGIAPPQKLINLISERREILYIEALREYYKSLPSYIELQQEIKSKNVKVNQPIDILIMQGETCVIPGARKIDDGYISYPIVFINIGTSISVEDHNVIHELNHLIETNLLEYNEGIVTKCGWEEMNTNHPAQKIRPREVMNETVNEYFANEIASQMEKEGIYLFTNPDTEKEYIFPNQAFFFIIQNLLNTFKKEVIESRWYPNFIGYADKLGEDNINKLNSIFHQAATYFPRYQTVNDIIPRLTDGIQDEDTHHLQELMTCSDEIYQNIKDFNSTPKQYTKTQKKGAI